VSFIVTTITTTVLLQYNTSFLTLHQALAFLLSFISQLPSMQRHHSEKASQHSLKMLKRRPAPPNSFRFTAKSQGVAGLCEVLYFISCPSTRAFIPALPTFCVMFSRPFL
jgi:hypothetical protein